MPLCREGGGGDEGSGSSAGNGVFYGGEEEGVGGRGEGLLEQAGRRRGGLGRDAQFYFEGGQSLRHSG